MAHANFLLEVQHGLKSSVANIDSHYKKQHGL